MIGRWKVFGLLGDAAGRSVTPCCRVKYSTGGYVCYFSPAVTHQTPRARALGPEKERCPSTNRNRRGEVATPQEISCVPSQKIKSRRWHTSHHAASVCPLLLRLRVLHLLEPCVIPCPSPHPPAGRAFFASRASTSPRFEQGLRPRTCLQVVRDLFLSSNRLIWAQLFYSRVPKVEKTNHNSRHDDCIHRRASLGLGKVRGTFKQASYSPVELDFLHSKPACLSLSTPSLARMFRSLKIGPRFDTFILFP